MLPHRAKAARPRHGRPTSGEDRVFSTGPALQKSDTVSNFVQTWMRDPLSVISPRLERPEDQLAYAYGRAPHYGALSTFYSTQLAALSCGPAC